MVLTDDLTGLGFSVKDADITDLDRFIEIKRECFKKYMDQYCGGWIDEIQVIISTDSFKRMQKNACFQKILLNGSAVGFYAYDEQEDKIGGILIQMTEAVRNKGLGSCYLKYITALSRQTKKPVFLHVFKSNPALNLLKRFGFEVYDQSRTHFLMSFYHGDVNKKHFMEFNRYTITPGKS